MRRLGRIFTLLVFVLALGSTTTYLPGRASPAQSRLVVFETFMRPG
jgi:hypothetical protein